MSERDGLLHAIRDNPDDDRLRLVLADWLEDHGDPDRADFVRTQVERATLPDEDDRQAELEARERRLLLKHGDRWVPAELPISWTRFRRGLPEVLTPDMPSWLTDEQVQSLGPLPIRELWLAGGGEEVDTGRLREMDLMERVERVRLYDRFSDADAWDLLSSSRLRRVRWLDVSGVTSGVFLGRVFGLPAVDEIERLVLGAGLPSHAVGPLAARHRLEELSFAVDPLTTSGAELLMETGLWRRARIALMAVGPAAARLAELLCQVTSWGGLRHLSLGLGRMESEPIERLLRHPAAAGLRQVALFSCPAELLARLADSPDLANLADLFLDVGERVLGLLARSRHLGRLNRVIGWGEDGDVIDFVNSPNADHVRLLCPKTFSDRVARAFADSPHLGRLTTLQGSAKLTDAAAEALAGSPHLKCLTWISLDAGALSARGQQALLEAEHLGWVGLHEEQLKDSRLRRLWRARYGDGEPARVLPDGFRERL